MRGGEAGAGQQHGGQGAQQDGEPGEREDDGHGTPRIVQRGLPRAREAEIQRTGNRVVAVRAVNSSSRAVAVSVQVPADGKDRPSEA